VDVPFRIEVALSYKIGASIATMELKLELDQPIGVVAAETAKESGAETFHERLEWAVVWVSTLKPASTLFANWLLLHQLRQGNKLPTYFGQALTHGTNDVQTMLIAAEHPAFAPAVGYQRLAALQDGRMRSRKEREKVLPVAAAI